MRLSFMASLKACAEKKDFNQGCKLHADIRASGLLDNDTCLANTLVSMYAKCGALVRAQQVFDELPVRNAVSWTALIAGYAQHGQGQEALGCFRRMQTHGFFPNAVTYACALKACGIMQDADLGKNFRDEIVRKGLLKQSALLGGALVDMYAKCGMLLKAQEVFDTLPICNAISRTALIAGFVQYGQGEESLGSFHRMRGQGFSPDAVTYACILNACGLIHDIDMGKQIHDEIASKGLLRKNHVLGGALVDMYAKCGVLAKAQEVFDEVVVQNVISWTALIAGYVQHGQGQEALGCFCQMQSQGISPNAVTYACALKACGMIQDVDLGKRNHDEIVHQSLLKNNIVLGGALLDMYARCGVLLKASKAGDGLSVCNMDSWIALIAGYTQQGQGQEALTCFLQMRSEGLSPNEIVYACMLKACGIMQDVDLGQQIHDEIVSQGLLKDSVLLGGALVDMYAAYGVLSQAQKNLSDLPIRDVVSWTALIAGYVEHGQGQEALDCFHRMRKERLSPNAVTYACTLKACGIMQNVDMENEFMMRF